MIKERRNQLMHIYNLTQKLSNWLWMGIFSGDEKSVLQDIEWAKQIQLQIAEGLFGYTGTEKSEMGKPLRTMRSEQDRRGGMEASPDTGNKPVRRGTIKTTTKSSRRASIEFDRSKIDGRTKAGKAALAVLKKRGRRSKADLEALVVVGYPGAAAKLADR